MARRYLTLRMPLILIIDDNTSVGTALDVLFSLHDIETMHASSPEQGLALLDGHAVDLVIQDMNFTEEHTSELQSPGTSRMPSSA